MPANSYRVQLFRHGCSQALRIPRALELDGDEAELRREGHRLIIEPVAGRGLLATLQDWGPIEEPVPDVDADLAEAEDVRL